MALPHPYLPDTSLNALGAGLPQKEEARHEGRSHRMAFTLQGLEVASDYAAVVRVRNKYGWSAESTAFSFSTKKGE